MAGQKARVGEALARCRDAGIDVALFIDPDLKQVEAAVELGAPAVEFHTGRYADARPGPRSRPRARPAQGGRRRHHRRRDWNCMPATASIIRTSGRSRVLPRMEELNIGHSIVSRAVFVGLKQAVFGDENVHRSAISAPLANHG